MIELSPAPDGAGRCMGGNSILFATVQTVAPNDITSARWLHTYPGYFGFTFYTVSGCGDTTFFSVVYNYADSVLILLLTPVPSRRHL